MSAKLVVVDGKARGAEFALGAKPMVELGSGAWLDVPLDDPDVARVHLKVYRDNDDYFCFDLSGRGFLHNGRRALKAELKHGDVIQLGAHKFRFDRPTAAQPTRGAPTKRYEEGGVAIEVLEPKQAPRPPTASDVDAGRLLHGRVTLHAVKGNDAGKVHSLSEKDVYVIGRGVASDITVWDIRASRVHCRIDRKENGLVLTDLNSSNGTYLNGQRCDMQRLTPGDEIKIGSTVLKVQVE